jgi:hypothetical protein
MGEAELDSSLRTITIHSNIISYGTAADEEVTARMAEEISRMWNEPEGIVYYQHEHFQVIFKITWQCRPEISELEILQNTDPRNNYFRIEKFVHGDISFVDGLGCNTGFFKLDNLYEGSTTAAHEYGHTLGLNHPDDLDLRGKGVPGIMYPRGTLVDPQYQYDPLKPAGATGGTMHPMHRKVLKNDIELLKLHKVDFRKNLGIVGEFTNVYHWPHKISG